MPELLNVFLVVSLFVVGVILMLYPPERRLSFLVTLLLVLLGLALLALNLQVVALPAALARVQGLVILGTVLLGGVLVRMSGVTERLAARWAGADAAVPSTAVGRRLPASAVPLARHTWIPDQEKSASTTALTLSGVNFREYDVLERVGTGGMANVYLARRRSDGLQVALKVPQQQYLTDTKFVQRFFREADMLRGFDHPNVVRVYDYSMEGGEHYIAMEYLDGISLEQLMEERTLTLPQAVTIFRALADGLRHIHLHNVIHRDLKPANVMVLHAAWESGDLAAGVKLMDFGVATSRALSRLTMTGARVGTPTYMAPEQAQGVRTDIRTDIYSLGLLGYEMVTGTPAFEGGYETVLHQQVFMDPRPPNQLRRDVPSRLNDLILSMIEKDPDKRPNLDEVIRALDGGILTDDAFDDPVVLAVGVDDAGAALRLLDLSGKLRVTWGAEEGVTGVPQALCSAGQGGLLLALPQSRQASAEGMVQLLRGPGPGLTFGRHGLGEGDLMRPVAVARLAGRLYVLDAESHYVNVYGEDGGYLFRFGGRGSGEGEFERPHALAATRDELCVLDSGNHRVQRFTPDGQYVSRLAFRLEKGSDALRPLTGLAATDGAVYMVDSVAGKVRRVDADGTAAAPVALNREIGESADSLWLLAVGPGGQVYAAPQGSSMLRVFSASGDLLALRNLYAPIQSLAVFDRGGPPGALA